VSALSIFNAVVFLVCILVIGGLVPKKWYDSLVRGLHATIGITTPTDRQVRAVLVVWLISMLAIVDTMAALLKYVF
jgi:hypothetical protein